MMRNELTVRQPLNKPQGRGAPRLKKVASSYGCEPSFCVAEKLWLCAHLPQFPLDILTRGSAERHACVLAGGRGRRQRVVLANSRAAALGVRVGMPLGAVRVLGDLKVFSRDEHAEKRALEQLCAWAYQFTSVVSHVTPDGLLLEIGGSLKLFGGIDTLSQRLGLGLKKLGYRGYLAAAPTPLAATVLARAKKQTVVTSKRDLVGHLSDLPLDVMRFEPAQLEALRSMGVRTVGDCLRLPRSGLGRRLTPDIIGQLDRMIGRSADPRASFELPRVFESRLDLPWEVDNAQALGVASERLLYELVGYLKARCAVAGQLRWGLIYADGTRAHFRVILAEPSCDHAHFAMLLRERLMRTVLAVSVRGLELFVDDISHCAPDPTGDLFGQRLSSSQENWPTFIDRLRSRLGDRAVRGLNVVSDHRPENAWCYLKPRIAVNRIVDRGEGEPLSAPSSHDRPLWLTRRPLPLDEYCGVPEFDGPLHLIRDRERIESGWWDGGDVARDYFIATNPKGERLWIFRELADERAWYLHGIFE